MTSVVSGCAGFIGSNLVDELLKQGQHVIGLDNLLTGKICNLAKALTNPNFLFIECDVGEEKLELEGVSSVYHFASPASPVDFIKYPIQTLKAGSSGTENLLELARRNSADFLLASTSEVYGDPQEHPQKETYRGNVDPIGLRSSYDEAKRYAEALTMAYHRTYNMKTHIARLFNTYGPRMRLDDGRVVPSFISQAMQNLPITVYKPGTQTRSFCYVDDVVTAVIKLQQSQYFLPVNIGNPDERTILDFAKKIKRHLRSESEIILANPFIDDDPKLRLPDITIAQNVLNWTPTTSLDEGLTRTISFYRKHE